MSTTKQPSAMATAAAQELFRAGLMRTEEVQGVAAVEAIIEQAFSVFPKGQLAALGVQSKDNQSFQSTPPEENHCADYCCAQSWKALSIKEYTGKSIPEEISALVATRLESKAEVEKIRGESDHNKRMWEGQINRTKSAEHEVADLKQAMRKGWYCIVVRGRGEDEVLIFDEPPHGIDVRARQHPELAQYRMETSPIDDTGRMIQNEIRPVLDLERIPAGLRIIFVPPTTTLSDGD